MKKIVLACMLLLGTVLLHAADPVKMSSGNKAVFEEEAAANVVIDDHKTMIDGKNKPADVYYGEKSADEYQKFIDDVNRGHESFITYFNEKRGQKIKLAMTQDNDTAKYTLKVNVTSMNVGNAGGMIWGMSRKAGGALINGTMQLVDNQSGETVCEFEFAKVKGLMAPVFKARAISVYRYLADGLLDAIK